MKSFFSIKKIVLIFLFLIFAFAGLYLISRFVRSENYVYFGDNAMYFDRFRYISGLIKNGSFINLLRSISTSIETDYFNVSAIIPLSLVGFFDSSRLSYILSIYFLYFVVSAFLYFHLINKLSSIKGFKGFVYISLFSLFFLSPVLLSPILQGEPSAGGLILVFLSLLTFFKIKDYSKNVYFLNDLLLSFSLVLMPIFRRYFICYVIAFLFILSIDFFVSYFKSKTLKSFLNLLFNYLLILVPGIVMFLLMTGDLYKTYLGIGFGNSFDIFKFGSLYFTFDVIFARIGYLYFLIFLLSLVLLLLTRTLRRKTLILLGILLTTTFLFLRIEDFVDHHFYLIVPVMFVVIGLALVEWKSKFKNIFLLIFIFVNLLNFLYATVFDRGIVLGRATLLSQYSIRPLVRNDLRELKQIFNYLGNTVKQGQYIYVLTSSTETSNALNDEVFRNYCRDQGFEKQYICEQVLQTYNLDVLSGFPYHFFKADYVITTDPVLYIVRPKDQRIIGDFVKFVERSKDYRLIKSLPDGEITVLIYKRTETVSQKDIKALLNNFRLLYPNSIFSK